MFFIKPDYLQKLLSPPIYIGKEITAKPNIVVDSAYKMQTIGKSHIDISTIEIGMTIRPDVNI